MPGRQNFEKFYGPKPEVSCNKKCIFPIQKIESIFWAGQRPESRELAENIAFDAQEFQPIRCVKKKIGLFQVLGKVLG